MKLLFKNSRLESLRALFGGSTDTFYKARFVSVITMLMCVASLALAVFFLLSGAYLLEDTTRRVFTPFLAFNGFAFLAMNIAVHQGYYWLAAYAAFGYTILVNVVSISALGGFPLSVASPAILVIPVVAFFLFGRRMGLWSTFVVPVFFTLKWIGLKAAGIQLPNYSSAVSEEMNVIVTLFFVYAIVIGVLAAFDANASELRNELRAEQQKYEQLANQDGLTGLANARSFNALTDDLIAHPTRPFRLMYVDLDNFKPLNDTFGHEAGDFALKTIGMRLQNCLGSDDIAARIGGDEFVLILRGNMSDAEAADKMHCTCATVQEPIIYGGHDLSIGLSFGQSKFPEDGQTRQALLRKADAMMYQAKREKKRAA